MATKSIHRRDSALPATANRYAWRAPTVLALAAGLLYCINLGRLPHPDELHHALAARGLLDHGLPSIAEGVYERGLLHTYLVAGSYALFGDSLASARIPSVVCMALVAALLFVWLRREASSLAAWLGAGGFAVSPFAVDIAQFARFYAPQCLAFLVAAFLTYAAVSGRHTLRRRALLLVGALPPALLALNLQPTTLIGLVSIASWAGCVLGIPWLTAPSVPRRHKLAVIAIGVLALMVFLFSGLATTLWQLFRSTPLFNLKNADEFWYYHALYSLFYPTLWPLTGLLGFAAIATWRQPALFALLAFAVSFVLNSLAASKSLRYIIFAQPLLFAAWGMGLAAIWPPLRSFGMDLRQRLGPPLAAIGIRRRPPLGCWSPPRCCSSLSAIRPGCARRACSRTSRCRRSSPGRTGHWRGRSWSPGWRRPTWSSPRRNWLRSISSAATTFASAPRRWASWSRGSATSSGWISAPGAR